MMDAKGGAGNGSGGFDYQPRTRLIFGNGSVNKVGELVHELGGHRVLLVTDPGIVKAGHAEKVISSIRQQQLEVVVFDQVRENPTTHDVAECLKVAEAGKIDFIVGLGGGSSMDTAKGCNFLLTNGGRMQDYWGLGKATKPMLPLIAIPTTAGTGSECQSYALIADEVTHAKMACGDPKAAAKIAILDPVLTVSQPRKVTACTGIDAIAHAVETAVTRKRSAWSLMYSHEAFKLCVRSFPIVLEHPENVQARGDMLLGAALAGMAIESSMLGAAHSAANPLTANFGTIHGEAVGMMLPHIMRFNSGDREALQGYGELASAAEIACVSEGLDNAFTALVQRIEELLNLAGIPRSLQDVHVKTDLIPQLAEEASKQWTATFNPRAIAKSDFIAIYNQALEPR
jgi:alcohol dehydrogenase